MTCVSFQGTNSSQESGHQGCRYVYELQIQNDGKKRVLWNNGQLMITNAQGAECTVSAFCTFSVPVLLC